MPNPHKFYLTRFFSSEAESQPKPNKIYCSKDSLSGFCIKFQANFKINMRIWDCLIKYETSGDYLINEDSLIINLTTLENYTTKTSLNLYSIEKLDSSESDSIDILVNLLSKERNQPIPFGEIFLSNAPSFEASTKIKSYHADQMGNAYLKVPKDSTTYFVSTGYTAEYWQFFPFEANTNQAIKVSLGDLFQIPELPQDFKFIILESSKKKILVKDLNSNIETLLLKNKGFR